MYDNTLCLNQSEAKIQIRLIQHNATEMHNFNYTNYY